MKADSGPSGLALTCGLWVLFYTLESHPGKSGRLVLPGKLFFKTLIFTTILVCSIPPRHCTVVAQVSLWVSIMLMDFKE